MPSERTRTRSEKTKESEDSDEKQSDQEQTTCSNCGGRIINDEVHAERVCEDCGMVVEADKIDHGPEWRAFNDSEQQSKSRVGAPTTKTMHDKGLTTTIDWKNKDAYGRSISASKRAQMSRLREWQQRIRTKDATERNLQFALSEIDRMASALGLKQNIREVASVTYRQALDEDLIRGRSIEGVASACLYAACRIENVPRSLEEIESASRVERKEISRTYLYIEQELGLQIKPVDPAQYVSRFCSELGLDEEVKKKAKYIIDVCKEVDLLSGKSPTGFAAAAIYAAARLCDKDVTQREVAEVSNVTEVTIRNRYQEQMKLLGQLFQDEEKDEGSNSDKSLEEIV
jgi:transcription initiation factor TFIIB